MSGYDVHAIVRSAATLLRGPMAERVALMTAQARSPRKARSAHGWIIPTSQLDDVRAYAQAHRLILSITDKRVKP